MVATTFSRDEEQLDDTKTKQPNLSKQGEQVTIEDLL